MVSFHSNDDTLAERVTATAGGMTHEPNADGEVAFFEHSGDTYVFISDEVGVTAGDALIKLVGVTGLSDSTIMSNDLTIA